MTVQELERKEEELLAQLDKIRDDIKEERNREDKMEVMNFAKQNQDLIRRVEQTIENMNELADDIAVAYSNVCMKCTQKDVCDDECDYEDIAKRCPMWFVFDVANGNIVNRMLETYQDLMQEKK